VSTDEDSRGRRKGEGKDGGSSGEGRMSRKSLRRLYEGEIALIKV